MKLVIKLILASIITSASLQALGHTLPDNGVTPLDEFRRPKERALLNIPDIGKYETLLCDLHMHTVFSDGLVWPTIRVQEAWQEGLDVIAITDHIEYQPHRSDLPTNHNRPFELASKMAEESGILLIRGSEITRSTPPGHFNAVFIEDASPFIEKREKDNLELDKQAIDLAARQDAFIFWNHPGWKVNSIEGSYEWIPFVEELYEEGNLHGIEVINGFHFHRKSLDWALEKGLAPLGSSDIHNLIAHDYDVHQGVHRSMTLLFVKERSVKGIREALDAQRSVAWSTRLLAGHQKWLGALFEGSVTVGDVYSVNEHGDAYSEIRNVSDLSFELELLNPEVEGWPETITLNPRTSKILRVRQHPGTPASAEYKVTNAFTGGDENLVVEIRPGS